MHSLLKIISYTGLVLTLIPAFLVFGGVIDIEANKNLMFFGTLAWFLTAPYWMNLKKKSQEIESSKEVRDRI